MITPSQHGARLGYRLLANAAIEPFVRSGSRGVIVVVGGEIVPADTEGAVTWVSRFNAVAPLDPIDAVDGQTRYNMRGLYANDGACNWKVGADGVLYSKVPFVRVAGPLEVHTTLDGLLQVGCRTCGFAGNARKHVARRFMVSDGTNHRCPPMRQLT